MALGHEYNAMSGLEREHCHWLAYRYDEEAGFRPDQGESWVGLTRGKELRSSFGQRGWMTSLYRTESKVWVSESAGRVYMNPKLSLDARWQTFELGGVLRGIWGLHDDDVFTWGLHQKKPVAHRWDGAEWRSIEPGGHIVGVHGIDGGPVVAVGQKGYVGRWDGARAFAPMTSAAKGTLSDVHVVSDDEIYACGTDGELVRGTVHGWEHVLTHPVALHCIAVWKEQVWVGGLDGLYVLRDDTLEIVKDNMAPIRFDARGELLVVDRNGLISTDDGVNFRGFRLSTFEKVASSRPPSWK